MSEKPFTDAEMARCFTCGHRGIEHAHGTGACFSVKKWAANCACPAFVAVDSQHDPVHRVLAKIDQGAPISRDEMHHAVHEAAHRRTPIAQRLAVCSCGHDAYQHVYHEGPCRPGFVCAAGCEKFTPHIPTASDANHSWEWRSARLGPPPRSTEGVTPAEMMEWPEMQALREFLADPIFDRARRPAPTREEVAAMAVHDALRQLAAATAQAPGSPHLWPYAYLASATSYLQVAANNLPSVTERIAP